MSTIQTIVLTNSTENEDNQDNKYLIMAQLNASGGGAGVESTGTTTTTTTVTLTDPNSQTFESASGTKFQKVILEDINIEDYYNETLEESPCRQFKFQIFYSELKAMVENSVLDANAIKPFRYLTGNFIKVFEKHVELFEKMRIPIQKRNNVLYEETFKNNRAYLRINGDCKLCPKMNRVKYVFTVKNKPDGTEKFVEVECKCRGVHNHSGTPTKGARARLSLPSSTTTAQQDKLLVLSKKRKYMLDDEFNSSMASNLSAGSMSPNGGGSGGGGGRDSGSSLNRLNAIDRNMVNQISTQIASKVMIKLDQINLKVNQISDRLFELERKLETVEVADIQLMN